MSFFLELTAVGAKFKIPVMRSKFLATLSLLGLLACAQEGSTPLGDKPAATESAAREEAALQELRARPDWLFPADECPADVMPQSEKVVDYSSVNCRKRYQACLADCRSGDGLSCYRLAQAIEESRNDGAVYQALYLRSCSLDIPLGCTNRAAGMINPVAVRADAYECAARSFERSCGRDDSWGCAMYGRFLTNGEGIEKDTDRAILYLEKTCELAPEDSSCGNAKALLKQID